MSSFSNVDESKLSSYIKIHRGTDQIGGTVTEIKFGDDRIFVDFGSQLQGAKETLELDIEGLTYGDANSTLLLTHYHGDHIGEVHRILPDVPVYFGELATEISKTLSKYLISKNTDVLLQNSKLKIFDRMNYYKNGVSFSVGNIKITPYSVDHSAIDSYMFLIEGNDVSILHTGDFRFHGFFGDEMWDVFKKIGNHSIDYLITEGTTLSRNSLPENNLSEEDYVSELKKIFDKHKYVAILCSSTNIDHLASIQHAMPSNKIIICDKYQKSILDVINKYQHEKNLSDIYYFDDENIGVLETPFYDKLKGKGYCALIRGGKPSPFVLKSDKDIHFIYSQWTGYLSGNVNADPKIVELEKIFEGRMTKLHTSGHVYKEDIKKMISILKPKMGIIPIHTESPEAFKKICGDCDVILLEDGCAKVI